MAARSLNKVMLIGNLTRDPELRYTPQGTPVCSFGLATNREWVDNSGQKQEEAEFHNIVAWGKLAEICSNLLYKGRKAFVEGRLSTRSWTGQDNVERKSTEIVIDEMVAFGQGRQGQSEGDDFDTGVLDTSDFEGVTVEEEKPVKKEKSKKTAKKAKKGAGKDEVKIDDQAIDDVADEIPF